MHLYLLVPVTDTAPPIPFGLYFHDNSDRTFDSKVIKKHWDTIINGILCTPLKLIGFTFDGAPSNRKASYN